MTILPTRFLPAPPRRLKRRARHTSCISVPGSLEIPTTIAIALDAARGRRAYDGAVALGCVIRGDTIHFEIVSQQSARGLMELSVARKIPIGNGIITVDTEAQAWARARAEEQDKGGDAAAPRLALIAHQAAAREAMTTDHAQRSAKRSAQGQQARRGPSCRGAGALSDGSRRHRRERDHGASSKTIGLVARSRACNTGRRKPPIFAISSDGVVREQRRLDPQIDAALHRGWPLKRIEAVLRAVLRAGAYELACRPDVPARVVTAEYVDVAGCLRRQGGDRHGQCRARPAGARIARGRICRRLEHDPEKWKPVFRKDHAQTNMLETAGSSGR